MDVTINEKIGATMDDETWMYFVYLMNFFEYIYTGYQSESGYGMKLI